MWRQEQKQTDSSIVLVFSDPTVSIGKTKDGRPAIRRQERSTNA